MGQRGQPAPSSQQTGTTPPLRHSHAALQFALLMSISAGFVGAFTLAFGIRNGSRHQLIGAALLFAYAVLAGVAAVLARRGRPERSLEATLSGLAVLMLASVPLASNIGD